MKYVSVVWLDICVCILATKPCLVVICLCLRCICCYKSNILTTLFRLKKLHASMGINGWCPLADSEKLAWMAQFQVKCWAAEKALKIKPGDQNCTITFDILHNTQWILSHPDQVWLHIPSGWFSTMQCTSLMWGCQGHPCCHQCSSTLMQIRNNGGRTHSLPIILCPTAFEHLYILVRILCLTKVEKT